MTASNHIVATADIPGVFKLMKDAFTDSAKVLLELMQNARRAGSPTVEIEYDEAARVMTVYDDGVGIDDFGTLLNLAKSGWDAKTASAERAFGAGFWSAVFGCERLHVESKGRGFVADTADILAFRPVELYTCDQRRTMIRMMGMHKPIPLELGYHGQNGFESAAMGFPIPVTLNGVALPRPMAESQEFEQTAIGCVRLGASVQVETFVYLQGFRVATLAGTSRRGETAGVVHLDSTQFRARAPDRDCLIDEADAKRTISAAVKAQWQAHYKALKDNGDHATLIRDASDVISLGCAHLLNDIPVLPGCVLELPDIARYHADAEGGAYPVPDLSMEDAARSPLILSRALPAVSSYGDLECLRGGGEDFEEELIGEFNQTMYLYLKQATIVRDDQLDPGHWIFRSAHCRSELLDYPRLSLADATDPVTVDGHCIDHVIVPCKSITFDGALGTVSSDRALGLVPSDASGAMVAVGERANTVSLCKMLSSFTDEFDHYMDDWYDDDQAALDNALTIARTGNVAVLLQTALWSLTKGSTGPLLAGRSFEVVFGGDGDGRPTLRVAERKAKKPRRNPAPRDAKAA
ncbi:hypothetical protein E4T66_17140 [Sinimarinibacterium sp. CAU 1509]|uniref:ATP-binding protein n=1 Tax=Sinimarinibacterium sp. CAU 1509 TaxID=2562283 RepID=UPI0010AC395F|nr:ATP-binding protein [Sinimarinibacterium sp. CAU 1509]TJY57136.1 hypothetical protein E4T66_17140 [Sinimarinibacterium sp. CAU 1509]